MTLPVLYLNKCCPYCHKATIAAAERNIPFEAVSVELGDAMPEWYKKINPMETVPTLQTADLCTGASTEKYIYESNLVAQYFDNLGSPAGQLMGSTPYQRHRVEFFLSQVGDLTGAAYSLLRDPYNEERRKFLEDNIVYLEGIMAETQTTGPYYLDEQFSMADVALLPFLLRFKSVLPYYTGFDLFAKAPRLTKLYAAGVKRPSVRKDLLTPQEYIGFYAKFLPKDFPTLQAKGNYILFGNRYCPFVDRVRVACALKGLVPFYIEVDLHPEEPWLKYVNRDETVPVLVTPVGEILTESLDEVEYLDNIFPHTLPKFLPAKGMKDSEMEDFIDCVGSFTSAMYGFFYSSHGKGARANMDCACRGIIALLDRRAAMGPFHGGGAVDFGDVALLPMLLRFRVYHPERTGGYDVLAAFPPLSRLLEAALKQPEVSQVFLSKEEYMKGFKPGF